MPIENPEINIDAVNTPRTDPATMITVNEVWSDCLEIAANPIQFSQGVLQGITHGLSEAHRRARRRVQNESWTARALDFERLLFDRGQTGIDQT